MMEEEAKKYINHHAEMQKEKESALKAIHEILIKSIEHSRNFYTQLSGFSLLIIAAVLQVLSSDNQTIIASRLLAIFGVILVAMSVLVVVLYLTYIISDENKRLNVKKKFYTDSFEEQTQKSLDFLHDGKKFSDYEEQYFKDALVYAKQEKEMNSLSFVDRYNFEINWCISSMFISGFILVSFSLFSCY